LLKEVIPMAETRYNIATDRNHRAIAGLSMGGGHSIYTGLNHPEIFAYVGAFSSAVVSPAFETTGWRPAAEGAALDAGFAQIVPNAKTQQPLKLFWMSVGTEDSLMPANRAFGKWAKANLRTEKPDEVQTRETPGMHTWMVWRDDLVDFTPLLFR
jgi:enterochelin esterase family protein